jgi:hypothetical protein
VIDGAVWGIDGNKHIHLNGSEKQGDEHQAGVSALGC